MGGPPRVSTKSSAANLAMIIGGLQESCLLGATATAHARSATRSATAAARTATAAARTAACAAASTTGTAATFAANDPNIFTMATIVFADAPVWAVD